METENPIRVPTIEERVKEVLERVKPYIKSHGGDIELVKVDEDAGIVFIRMKGACVGCPTSAYTIQMGIENEMKFEVPEIRQIVAV